MHIASLSLTRLHLASRTAAPLFQTQHHLNTTAPPSFPVTPSSIPASPRGYSSYFSLFFLFVFIFGYLFDLVLFFGCMGVFLFKTEH
jgi:hypothetical protein